MIDRYRDHFPYIYLTPIYLERRDTYFMKLVHTIVGTGIYKICSTGLKAADWGKS